MGLDALLATLEREAEAQRAGIEREAEASAARILAQMEAEVGRRSRLALDREGERVRRDSDREFAAYRRRLLEEALRARAATLDRIIARAEALIAQLSAPDYAGQVPGMVAATLRYLEGVPAVLECQPDLEAAVRAAAAGRPVRVVASAGARPGVVARAEDGSVTVDGSLAGRLARLRADLAIELAAAIGAGGEGAGAGRAVG